MGDISAERQKKPLQFVFAAAFFTLDIYGITVGQMFPQPKPAKNLTGQ